MFLCHFIFQLCFHFQIEKLLSDGGGVQKSYLSSAVTLCLAGISADDNELQGCIDINELPVVNLEWVRQSVRSVKCSERVFRQRFCIPPGQKFRIDIFVIKCIQVFLDILNHVKPTRVGKTLIFFSKIP